MPWDNVNEKNLQTPKKINTESIRTYMFWFGFASTVGDILCFAALWFICRYNKTAVQTYFQTGWFLYGVLSQTMVIFVIRTRELQLFKDRPSLQLVLSTGVISLAAVVIGFTHLSSLFGMSQMPPFYLLILLAVIGIYMVIVQLLKPMYVKKYMEWI